MYRNIRDSYLQVVADLALRQAPAQAQVCFNALSAILLVDSGTNSQTRDAVPTYRANRAHLPTVPTYLPYLHTYRAYLPTYLPCLS